MSRFKAVVRKVLWEVLDYLQEKFYGFSHRIESQFSLKIGRLHKLRSTARVILLTVILVAGLRFIPSIADNLNTPVVDNQEIVQEILDFL
jgi:hypothetical protein